MTSQHYCLRWNNYQSNMTSVFHQLLQNEDFVDVTLACDDLSLKAHKVVLSACSSYFQKLLLENPCKHPTIIMPQDIRFSDLKFIIEFVYKGEIDVSQTELQSLLKTADQLRIKGLCESTNERENPNFEHFHSSNVTRIRKSAHLVNEDPLDDCIRKEKVRKLATPKLERCELEEDVSNDGGKEEMPVNSDGRIRDPDQQRRTALNMSSQGLLAGQTLFSHFGVDTDDFPPEPPAPSAIPVGHVDMDHSPTRTLLNSSSIHRTDISDSKYEIKKEAIDIKFETLRSYDQDSLLEIDSHNSRMSGADLSRDSHEDQDQSMHSMLVTPELMGMVPGVSSRSEDIMNGSGDMLMGKNSSDTSRNPGGPKTWTQEDMDMALDALRNHNMSLTKASATYGIPSTTLWQRAHRLGIDTPKKEGPTKSWTEENLNNALDALRTGTISANKASKAFGIPSSTLYKIARREGIRLAAPFNAAPTTWTPEDLEKALESIRSGQTSVQKASTEFGIPTGTLYGRCKREGIELSRSNPTPWSEDAMGEALEAVRLGHMSINQAAIHYNLPYSSLYGRFKRGIKYDSENLEGNSDSNSHLEVAFGMEYTNPHPQQIQYQNQTS
ncbi:protein tramtrack, alpha isoform isoform X2 [Coccinella septempunctata]|nr:protein tramtrack, alpha isoform isoform X2 [Coccinella septempunctata]XP_044747866.1 protein tramtrack, alpha isoform isoform X2 [Coccinella septempunctata]XP_044747876.1 protein tramtrack, alpha isoform isoform X2 [Coccinella septempunctata]